MIFAYETNVECEENTFLLAMGYKENWKEVP
jgi:hypothetical protein